MDIQERTRLLLPLEERGYRVRVVAVERVWELQEEIAARQREGQLDETFCQLRLGSYRFGPPEELPGARSLIVVAVPRGQTEMVFHWRGRPHPFILPPTYACYGSVMRQVQSQVGELLRPAGYSVAGTALPLKLLAARSGLTAYGRNNIGYVPGMGSFLQLVAVYSDLPCPEDEWGEARMLERCQKCHACQRSCPTGAISKERFLLHAERCLSFHNERPADVPFPDWINPAGHTSPEGCMHCQRVCPEDQAVLGWIESREEFDEGETALFLEGAPRERHAPATLEKLERLEMDDDIALFRRNLGVLLLTIPSSKEDSMEPAV